MAPVLASEFQGFVSKASTSPSRASRGSYTNSFCKIKLLFFRRQYKKCASLCDETLDTLSADLHPVQRAILLFFAGLSYDTFARGMPNRSPAILSAVDDGERYYQDASTALAKDPLLSLEVHAQTVSEEADDIASYNPSVSSSNRSSLNHSARTWSSSAVSNTPSTAATSVIAEEEELGTTTNIFNLGSFQFPPLPPSDSKYPLPTANDENIDPRTLTSPPLSSLSQPSQMSFATKGVPSPDPVRSYHAHLNCLRITISTHIASLATFRASVLRAREREARFGHANAVKKEMTAEEKRERILKGRERGWKMSRFDRSRYEALAERALGELGR